MKKGVSGPSAQESLSEIDGPATTFCNTWMILFMQTCLYVTITLDINPINGLMNLSWWLQKGMTIVCRSYVIGHKFIKPTDESAVQYPPDINPICG